jgi:hypothetical protein
MKAKPNRFGDGYECVDIDWSVTTDFPFRVGGSEWYSLEDAKQLITNLQAAVDAYEEEYGQDTDD